MHAACVRQQKKMKNIKDKGKTNRGITGAIAFLCIHGDCNCIAVYRYMPSVAIERLSQEGRCRVAKAK